MIFYYSTTLWRAVGFSESDAMFTSVINSLVNVAFTLLAIALVDRVGRRPLLLAGCRRHGGLARHPRGLLRHRARGERRAGPRRRHGPIALVAANAFVASFAATWGPVVWVMLGEMFNNFIRASALAVAAAAQWLANWVITTTSRHLGLLLVLAYGIYTFFSILAFVFVLRAVPETKGRELEDMDQLSAPRTRT